MQPTQNQFTEKAWAAIAQTQDIARQAKHQQLESEHLMLALLDQEGLAASIFTRLEVSLDLLKERTENFIKSQPQVSGGGSSLYMGRSLDTLTDRAEACRKEYGDDFISIEHLILAYAKDERFGRSLFQDL